MDAGGWAGAFRDDHIDGLGAYEFNVGAVVSKCVLLGLCHFLACTAEEDAFAAALMSRDHVVIAEDVADGGTEAGEAGLPRNSRRPPSWRPLVGGHGAGTGVGEEID